MMMMMMMMMMIIIIMMMMMDDSNDSDDDDDDDDDDDSNDSDDDVFVNFNSDWEKAKANEKNDGLLRDGKKGIEIRWKKIVRERKIDKRFSTEVTLN